MLPKNPLLIILLNLIIFTLIELLSLSSLDIMTPARLLTHLGFLLNLILLILLLTSRKSA